jgi:hypothetical protein
MRRSIGPLVRLRHSSPVIGPFSLELA